MNCICKISSLSRCESARDRSKSWSRVISNDNHLCGFEFEDGRKNCREADQFTWHI